MKKLVLAVIAMAALSGCANNRMVTLNIPFDEAAARKLLEPGTNAIQGSGLIRQGGGGIVTCAGRPVVLIPNTAYAQGWMQEVFKSKDGGYKSTANDGVVFQDSAAFDAAQKTTQCDALGAFSFDEVADGEFYVLTTVKWNVATGFGPIPQGGALAKLVKPSGGKTTKVVLAP